MLHRRHKKEWTKDSCLSNIIHAAIHKSVQKYLSKRIWLSVETRRLHDLARPNVLWASESNPDHQDITLTGRIADYTPPFLPLIALFHACLLICLVRKPESSQRLNMKNLETWNLVLLKYKCILMHTSSQHDKMATEKSYERMMEISGLNNINCEIRRRWNWHGQTLRKGMNRWLQDSSRETIWG